MTKGQKGPTRSIYASTKEAIAKMLPGGIADSLAEYSYVLSVMPLMLLMLIPKN